MPTTLIDQALAAVRANDRMALRRIEQQAAEYDRHNPFGPRLVDEIRGLQPVAEVA